MGESSWLMAVVATVFRKIDVCTCLKQSMSFACPCTVSASVLNHPVATEVCRMRFTGVTVHPISMASWVQPLATREVLTAGRIACWASQATCTQWNP